ncbi:MAG TPA: aldehyde dehydrogenase family protein [Candidatus Aenigmarchaeota archaeon]|nr:aldehyde dehydrogenase family protein [Candidatus Aenigmarchaeota archaeon]
MGVWSRFFSSSRGVKTYRMFIGGEWVRSSNKATFDVINPANRKLVGRVQKATREDADKAIKSAWNARKTISSMPLIERARMLERLADLIEKYQKDFVDILVQEAGKPVCYAEGEVKAGIERLRFSMEEAKAIRGEYIPGDLVPDTVGKFAIVNRKPYGVVLAISPFNYPFFISITKISPAILAGNSVVLKAASDDPICMLMFARLAELAGIPEGVLNVITGSGSEIGDFMVSHPKVGMISFTGSSAAGKHIASVAGMKKLHLELGGKCPGIVFEDADMDLAVRECVKGALKFSGQRCDSLSRILVQEKIANTFVKKVLAEVKNWKVGDPRKKSTRIGPLINEKAADKVEELVRDAVSKGARLLTGGKRRGLYFEPTVLDRVKANMRIAWEETFGPVVTIIRFRTFDEAIKISNQSGYGLDASVFTRDIDKAVKAANLLECGSVTINAAPAHGLGNFPFGGDKDSGIGREGLVYSVEEMTKLHTIVFKT